MTKRNEGQDGVEDASDNSPVMMWRTDRSSACDWVNSAWLEFTGRTLEQELGFGWVEGLHPEDMHACLQAYKAALKRGEPFSLCYRLRRADGAFRWVRENAQPIKDDSGAVVGCQGACTDVDEIVRANEELSLALRERAEAVAQRDHLLREVQHRVRNNLQLILSIIDMQARNDPSSRAALSQVAGRVRSIAKAQALLLDPTGKAEIDLLEYVPSLLQGATVTIETPDEPVLMPIARAVPLGLIINEILSATSGDGSFAPHRILIIADESGARIVIEAEKGKDPEAPTVGTSTLIQRLSAQAGARVEAHEGPAMSIVLKRDRLT